MQSHLFAGTVTQDHTSPTPTPLRHTSPCGGFLEIAVIIGKLDAFKIVDSFGGTTVRLPALRNLKEGHPLARCIGLEKLTKLVKESGGGRWFYVPHNARGLLHKRDCEIVKLYSPPHNVPAATLARRFNLSDRHIWRILGRTVIEDTAEFFI